MTIFSDFLVGAHSEKDCMVMVVCDQMTYKDLVVLVSFSDDGRESAKLLSREVRQV